MVCYVVFWLVFVEIKKCISISIHSSIGSAQSICHTKCVYDATDPQSHNAQDNVDNCITSQSSLQDNGDGRQ